MQKPQTFIGARLGLRNSDELLTISNVEPSTDASERHGEVTGPRAPTLWYAGEKISYFPASHAATETFRVKPVHVCVYINICIRWGTASSTNMGGEGGYRTKTIDRVPKWESGTAMALNYRLHFSYPLVTVMAWHATAAMRYDIGRL